MPFRLGTAVARPGRLAYGVYDLVAHPTGGLDQMPVVLAQGDPRGPVFWLTAGIHGSEHAGLHVVHQLLTRELTRALHGTVVAIPALSPAGLRTMQRRPYYHDGDPNRLFPEVKPHGPIDVDLDPPSALEQAYARLFQDIRESEPAAWIDLHNAWTNSLSFVFRDRVYYDGRGAPARVKTARLAAERLDAALEAMCRAYGHTVVHELPPHAYFHEKLHRSSTSAAVNAAGLPALTMELGTGHMPDPAIVRASVVGLRNLLRWAGMLDSPPEPITGVRTQDLGFACRRRGAPRVTQACIVRHLLEPGDRIEPGQPVAELSDIWGRPTAEKVLYSEYDGFVVGRTHGVVYYPGTELYTLAVRDDLPTVQPYPDAYWK